MPGILHPLPVLALLLGGACVATESTVGDEGKAPGRFPDPAPPASPAVPEFDRPGGGLIADVAERSVRSVVNISSEKVIVTREGRRFGPFFQDPFFEYFFGDRFRTPQVPRERRERSLGSGVIVSEDGILLTANHVIEQADRVLVTLADGREFEADIVGTDPPTDLGVLRIPDPPEEVEPLAFGDSDRLRLGEVVLAIGNPFGVGQTVTMGIVSAKGRANVGIVDYEDFIQTDAAINPGNSGGALVNTGGNLVGINTAIISRTGGYQGIGFAIPSNMAKGILDSLLEHGRVVRGWLGVTVQEISPELVSALDLPTTRGVIIADVQSGGPADRAGLRRGDVILRIDGEAVKTPGRLRNLVAVTGADAGVKLDILRDGRERQVEVTLGDLGGGIETAEIDVDSGPLGGLTVGRLDDEARERFRILRGLRNGVVVTDVVRRSPGGRAGFRPGDVLLELNRTPIQSVDHFQELYGRTRGLMALLVQRGRETFFLTLEKNR